MKNPLIYLFALTVITFTACFPKEFESLNEETFPEITPCSIKMLMSIPESTPENTYRYTLIGICSIKRRALFNTNRAIVELEKTACKKGANLVRILNHEVVQEAELGTFDPSAGLYGLYSQRDIIEAELWLEEPY